MGRNGQPAGPIAGFREAVEFLEQGIDYEKTRDWKYDKKSLDLRSSSSVRRALGEPHRGYDIIHVAGTKGKGSTAGAVAQCLQRCGHRTALLTSPHLITARERVRVDGAMIGEEAFRRIVARMQPYVEGRRRRDEGGDEAPTYFEMLTALAFEHFAERKVDWAVVEVGLGGRLDSTNVVVPRCCVITAIGFDHMDKLGDTPEAIAAEKGGILKEGIPVVIGRQPYADALETLRRMADERNCPRWEVGRELVIADARPTGAPVAGTDAEPGWRFSLKTPTRDYGGLFTPLLGAHQLDNLAAAIGALELMSAREALAIDAGRMAGAIAEFRMPARVELLQPRPALVLDVAHTVESVRALLDALDVHFPGRPLRVVFGCSAGKDLAGMLRLLLSKCISFTATQASVPRALPANEVAEAARRAAAAVAPQAAIRTVGDPWEALQRALSEAEPGDVVCVTGSFYVAGEVRAGWLRDHRAAADQSGEATGGRSCSSF